MMTGFDSVAVAVAAQSVSTQLVNRMRGMKGWGWKLPNYAFLVISMLYLVFDSGIVRLLPLLLVKMHLMHPH